MIERLMGSLHLTEFGLRSAVEIVVLAFFLYRLLLLIRGTRAVQMLYGLVALIFLSWITGPQVFGLATIHRVLVEVLIYVPFAIIVVFQNTIRRALTGFGANPFGRYLSSSPGDDKLNIVVSAAYTMAARRIGGLIIMEREQGLRNWTESGIPLDALVSFDLIVNVFSPYTPLHDGALIIGDGRLKAASCFLPLTSNPALSTKYGTRHRAGIGITEETDAVSIIVSEERGTVSLAIDGVVQDNLEKTELRQILNDVMESPLRRREDDEPAKAGKETTEEASSTRTGGGVSGDTGESTAPMQAAGGGGDGGS
jgi:uncharacterized protein (TIGR00159 family)